MSVRRPNLGEIRNLAEQNHFDVGADEESAYGALFERVLQNYDALAQWPLAPIPLKYPQRSAGERPADADNFCNAIVRRCSVRGAAAGRLAQVRVGLKDSISLAGVPLTCGSRVFDYTPAQDATIVTRILDEGANIVAILNMDNCAFSGAGDTSAYGPTFNPHSSAHLAGGSSGGSAAALFAGDIDLTIGCDQAGSIRIPASWCGVVGIKPTFGLVPYTGILGFDLSFDHTGPMARTVREVAVALDVLAGKDSFDPRQGIVPLQHYTHAAGAIDLSGLRIGILEQGFGTDGAEDDVDACVLDAINALSARGATVVRVSCPAHSAAGAIVWGVFAEGVSATFQNNGQGHHWSGRYDPDLSVAFGTGMQQHAQHLPMQAKFNLLLGSYMRENYQGRFYAKGQSLRAALRAEYDRLLQDVDILVTPTTPMKAHRYNPTLNAEELVVAGWNMVANTAPFNMTGHPSLSVPCGVSQGLPVGMMLTGRHFDDAALLRAAAVVEAATR